VAPLLVLASNAAVAVELEAAVRAAFVSE